jgi:oxygen-independent coproporphyrinogen-3 oxidase
MATLYLHVPFCKRICSYCDFYKVGAIELLPKVVNMMHREMAERADYLECKELSSIYFGGGTPSLLRPEDIESLIQSAASLFDISGVREITLEANPDDLTQEYVQALSHTPINRVSLGIQSFDDRVLKFMNRRHTAEEAIKAVERLRKAGIENISIDIIFGVSGFEGDHLGKSLSEATQLGVEHISAYHLTIEERTRLGLLTRKGEYTPLSDEESEQEFLRVHHALTQAGYDHYEVSNFARPGRQAMHNSAYWRGVEYLGIGAGAHSFSRDNRTWCISSAKEYSEGMFRYEDEQLTPLDHLNEYVMVSLRTERGIDLNYIAQNYGLEHQERIAQSLGAWISSGAVVREGTIARIPADKFLISDAVIESLFA